MFLIRNEQLRAFEEMYKSQFMVELKIASNLKYPKIVIDDLHRLDEYIELLEVQDISFGLDIISCYDLLSVKMLKSIIKNVKDSKKGYSQDAIDEAIRLELNSIIYNYERQS